MTKQNKNMSGYEKSAAQPKAEPPAAKPKAKPPAKELTIVVVGMSQAGKSTLLNLVYKVLNKEPPQTLAVGGGNESCTMDASVYDLHYPTQECDPFFPKDDPEFMPPKEGISHDEYMEKFFDRCDYKANHRNDEQGREYKIKIIDTPGYDDSTAGKDEEHAYKILQKLRSCEEVNAFLFVLGRGTHYGGGFQSIFEQYWNTFDRFRDRFMIVQTKWDPSEEEFEKKKQDRVESFRSTFQGQRFSQVKNLKHIFIESSWGKKKMHFPEHKLALAIQRLNEIFTVAATHDPYPTAALEYFKTKAMRDKDMVMLGFLQGKLAGANKALENVNNENARMNEEISEAMKNSATARTELKILQDRLKDIDNDELHQNGSETVTYAGHYFSKTKTFVKIKSLTATQDKCPIWKEVHDIDGDYSYSKWEDVKIEGNVLSGTLCSPWWTGHKGTLTASVRNKDYFAEEVHQKKSEAESLSKQIALNEARVEVMKRDTNKNNKEAKSLQEEADLVGACIGELKHERLKLDSYLQCRDYYACQTTIPEQMFKMYLTVRSHKMLF